MDPRVLPALADAVDAACAGFVPPGLADIRLFAPAKGPAGSGYRPLGPRELVVTLAARIALPVMLPHMQGPMTEQGQLATVPDGTQRALSRVDAALRGGCGVILVDLANAYNSISRKFALEAIPRGTPGIALARAIYPASYYARLSSSPEPPVESTRGLHQGCPLASMLFAHALAVGPVRLARADVGGSVRPLPPSHTPWASAEYPEACGSGPRSDPADVWYADDGTIAVPPGTWQTAVAYARALEVRCREVGLHVSASRPGKVKTAIMLADPCETPPDDPWVRARCAVVSSSKVLGVPVAAGGATGPLVRRAVRATLADAASFTRDLTRLGNSAHVLHALRLAGSWTRIEYIVSLLPAASVPPDALADCEAADAFALMHALGPFGCSVDVPAWSQAGLPLRLGGLGVRRPTVEAQGARIRAACRMASAEGLPPPPCAPPPGDDHRDAEADEHARSLDSQGQARMAALRSSGGACGDWLRGPFPSPPNDMVFGCALALRLGLQVFPLGEDGWCIPCPGPCAAGPDAALDRLGQHMMGCCRGRTHRHDDVRDALFAYLRRMVPDRDILREAACDDAGEAHPGASNVERPGDVAIRAGGGWTFIDVSVCSLGHADSTRAARDGLLASRRAWRLKDESGSAARVRRSGAGFLPMAFGAWGDMYPCSAGALETVIVAAGGTKRDAQQVRPTLSAAVALGTARAVVRARSDVGCRLPPVSRESRMALAARLVSAAQEPTAHAA